MTISLKSSTSDHEQTDASSYEVTSYHCFDWPTLLVFTPSACAHGLT